MHSRAIGALGPPQIKKMNRNALNISIFRIGHPKKFFKTSPFPPTKFHLIEISLGRQFFPKICSLNMLPFIILMLGLLGLVPLILRVFEVQAVVELQIAFLKLKD